MAETTIYSSASDGYLYKPGASYNEAWAATTGTPYTSAKLYIGQSYSLSIWSMYRSAVFFDTSSIPDDAEITSVTLSLYGYSDISTQDFNITVQSGMPYYPHNPLVEGDYNKENYSGDGGALSTAGFTTSGYNTITLNEDGRGWINKGGWTKLFLRSDRDIAGAEPVGYERVSAYANEEAGKQPYLHIEYSIEGVEDTGATYPGLGSNEDHTGLPAWDNPVHIQTDSLYAVWTGTDTHSDWLRGSNFGFSVPSGSIISGIKLDMKREELSGVVTNSLLYLVDSNGTNTGNSKHGTNQEWVGLEEVSYGGSSDLWGATLTPNIVNSSNFGARMSIGCAGNSVAIVYWYKITVYYSPLVTDWVTPSAVFSETRSGSAIGWTNPSYASTSSDSHTTAVVPQSGYTDWLRATQFGFTGVLPFDSIPVAIDVKIERKAEIADNLCDSSLRLRKTAGQTGDDGASDTKWGTTDAEVIHHISFAPGALSYDDVVSDDFGIDLSVLNDADAVTTAYVDCVSVRIHYFPWEVSTLEITPQEYYNTGDNTQTPLWKNYWKAQTFTPATTYKITSVKLLLLRYLSTGTITVSIRATDVDGLPTGSDLCSGTTDGDDLPAGSPYEWREIILGAGYQLSASIKYAIVIRAPTPTGNGRISWRADSSGEYAEGNYVTSYDSGSTWGANLNYDYMFEVWGQVGDPSTGGKILLETGDALLQENDFYLLLEYIGGAAYYRIISAELVATATIARKAAIKRTISSAATLASVISRVFGRKRTTASALTLTGTIARKVGWKRATSSNLTLTNVIDITVGAIQKYFITIASNLNISATIARKLIAQRATASSLTVSATISGIKGFVRTVASSLTLTATISRTATFTRTISSGLDLTATIVITAVGKLLMVIAAMGNVYVVKPVEGGIYAIKTALGNIYSMKVIEGGIYKLKTALGRIYRMIIKE